MEESRNWGTQKVGFNLKSTKLCYKIGIKSKLYPYVRSFMAKIEDTGKVWFPGAFGPEYAVRVDDRVFVPGKAENQSIDCRVIGDHLVVDLHDTKKPERILRRFPLNAPPNQTATLFNGFEKTKHADVQVVTYKDSGVEETTVAGDTYNAGSFAGMEFEVFYKSVVDSLQKKGSEN